RRRPPAHCPRASRRHRQPWAGTLLALGRLALLLYQRRLRPQYQRPIVPDCDAGAADPARTILREALWFGRYGTVRARRGWVEGDCPYRPEIRFGREALSSAR